MNDVTDLRRTIIPKSDQLNAEQLLGGPMVVTVTDVRVGSSEEQPISIHYENDGGRPFKPCKTMRKVLIHAWGQNGNGWVGKSMELFNEPTVKFGGEQVGGIRIARLSDIPSGIRVSLTATKGKKALHEIGVLRVDPPKDYSKVIASLEVTAKAKGLDALRDAWELLSEEDAAAIGKPELKRLKALAQPPKTPDAAATES